MKTGRNEPCPCGSGRKFKHCCLAHGDTMTGTEHRNVSPKSTRLAEGISPLIQQAQEVAEYEARRPAILATHDELEKHRKPYEKLFKNPKKFFNRTEKLFAEPTFESMRFSANDLQRAFEGVGYPPASQRGDELIDIAGKALNFLLNEKQRDALARRLLCMLPDFVAEGRHLDAWIIQHSAILLNQPPEGGFSPFLMCMFLQGMKEWDANRDQEQLEMFRHLGLDVDDIRRKGFAGVESMIAEMIANPDKTAAVEKFLETHPELKAFSQAQCQKASGAAQHLLQREDAWSLLLAYEEVEPWFPEVEQRMRACPGVLDAMQRKVSLSEKQKKALTDCLYSLGGEMAESIFSKDRLQQLGDALRDYRSGLSRHDQEGMIGVNGALMEVQSTDPVSKNHFLAILCTTSLFRALEEVQEVSDVEPPLSAAETQGKGQLRSQPLSLFGQTRRLCRSAIHKFRKPRDQ